MKAVILAAGRGSRMKGLTEDVPKCFLELDGKRLLDWQIEALREAGINDIVVARGYKKETIDYKDIQVVDNDRWDQTNMVSSLMCASKVLEEDDVIVSYADIVYHPDIVHQLKKQSGDVAITYDRLWHDLWKMRFEDPLKDAESFKINDEGEVIEIGQRISDKNQIEGQYMGLLKFTPAGWQQVVSFLNSFQESDIDKMDMTMLLQGLIKSDVSVTGVAIDGKWVEADNAKDLEIYEQSIKQADWSHDWRK